MKDDKFHGYNVTLRALKEEDGGGWFAEVKELQGCCSDGETPEEALENVRDAIEGWIDLQERDGKPIPVPRSVRKTNTAGSLL